LSPSACGDGSVVYQTFKDDHTAIWRIASDGSDPELLVGDDDPLNPVCSPDGKWIVYVRRESGQSRVVRMTLADRTTTELLRNTSGGGGVISPDGTLVAAHVWAEGPSTNPVHVVAAAGGPPLHVIRIPPGAGNLSWSPDGKALHYLLTRQGASNVWEQPLAGGPPRQITNFADGAITGLPGGFSWSRDGKQLAIIRGEFDLDIALMTNFN
jgi:Tol biopolymer transport system component